MRLVILVVTTLVVIVSTTKSASQDPPIPPELLSAAAARAAAVAKGSATGIAPLIADDFVWVDADGRRRDKMEMMRSAAGGSDRPAVAGNPFQRSDSTHRVYGDSVIRMWVTKSGEPVQAMEVWSKVNGEWKMTHLQHTPLR
jgi:hypothetical protein